MGKLQKHALSLVCYLLVTIMLQSAITDHIRVGRFWCIDRSSVITDKLFETITTVHFLLLYVRPNYARSVNVTYAFQVACIFGCMPWAPFSRTRSSTVISTYVCNLLKTSRPLRKFTIRVDYFVRPPECKNMWPWLQRGIYYEKQCRINLQRLSCWNQ